MRTITKIAMSEGGKLEEWGSRCTEIHTKGKGDAHLNEGTSLRDAGSTPVIHIQIKSRRIWYCNLSLVPKIERV